MYYAKGNPYSADVIKKTTSMDRKTKMSIYTALVMISIVGFCIKGYSDLGAARNRSRAFAQQQIMMQQMNNQVHTNNSRNNLF